MFQDRSDSSRRTDSKIKTELPEACIKITWGENFFFLIGVQIEEVGSFGRDLKSSDSSSATHKKTQLWKKCYLFADSDPKLKKIFHF